jgi:AcrR family transcriptional regulator
LTEFDDVNGKSDAGQTAQPGPADRIAGAAVILAGQRGWRSLALGDIANHAGVTLEALARHYVCRPEILDGFERMMDRRMLAGAAAGDIDDKPRDRLFDIIMERFDGLLPYRDGVRRITRELPFDPASGLVLATAMPRSVAWMFAGARITLSGPTAPLKLAALGAVYLSAFRVFLNEDGQDIPKTMAVLDRNLDRASAFLIGDIGTGPSAAQPSAAPPAAEVAVPDPAPETAASPDLSDPDFDTAPDVD